MGSMYFAIRVRTPRRSALFSFSRATPTCAAPATFNKLKAAPMDGLGAVCRSDSARSRPRKGNARNRCDDYLVAPGLEGKHETLDDSINWGLEPRTGTAIGKLRKHGSCRCRANRVAGKGTS